ncbi:MAG: four-carbon acid sugar kinase family protein, partial [Burkholderiaceae bacterium]
MCSTFDSAPEIGSIGHVADLAHANLTPGQTLSLLAGAPPLRRYTIFGNHYAAAGDEIYRLDRHPTMSRHPTTPMHEADLRVHLSYQTRTDVALMSLVELTGEAGDVDARHARKLSRQPGMLLYDVADDRSSSTVGRLIWQRAQQAPHFAIGSSGVEYALTAHWQASGVIATGRATFPAVSAVKQLLVISGSASPMTATQIRWAAEHGFECVRAPTEDLCRPQSAQSTAKKLFERALAALSSGKSVVVYTAVGPDDPSIGATRETLAAGSGNSAKVLGSALGQIARALLSRTGLRRVVVAGGDTSSYATQELGLYGLEMLAELTPGAPLCHGYSEDPRFDGLQIALKGGQMGTADYFGMAR